ncbi:MAG: hypothetical protein IJA94_00095 [Bacilli bacterium]|nr:hypothetical protein [Bacilli bacterium]
MKRKLILLAFMICSMPFLVDAETNYDDIFNSISADGKITVNSIPIDKYKSTKYFNTCISRDYGETEEEKVDNCLSQIYSEIVSAQIKKTINIPEDIWVYSSSCNIEKNQCDIYVDATRKTFEIDFVENVDDTYFQKIENMFLKIKGSYRLYDMAYINQLINYSDLSGFFDKLQNSSEVFNIYPELKKELEKTTDIEYVSTFGGGGGGPSSYGAGGSVIAFHDNVAVGITEIGYITYRTIFIPDTTKQTREDYMKAALERIKTYINDDSYKVEIMFDEELNGDFCNVEWEECVINDVFKTGDKYNFDIYKIKINEKESYLGIVPVREKDIKDLEIKSTNYNTGIKVETSSSDVPMDAKVEAEDKTFEYNDEYYKAYDINLFSSLIDKYITSIKKGIIVKIPLEDDFDKAAVTIYHIKDDGTKGDKFNASVGIIDGKKYAIFNTNHFSTYAIAKEDINISNDSSQLPKEENNEIEKENIKTENNIPPNPTTSDNINSKILLLIVSSICLIGCRKLNRKKICS